MRDVFEYLLTSRSSSDGSVSLQSLWRFSYTSCCDVVPPLQQQICVMDGYFSGELNIVNSKRVSEHPPLLRLHDSLV